MFAPTPPYFNEVGEAARPQTPIATRASRAARALSLSLIVALGSTFVSRDTHAEALEQAQAAPETAPAGISAEELEMRLAAVSEKISADLDTRIAAMADDILGKANQRHMAVLTQHGDPALVMSRQIDARIERELAALTPRFPGQTLADSRDPASQGLAEANSVAGESMRMESGSLELERQTLREVRDGAIEMGRHRFDRPFDEAPRIALGVRAPDRPRTQRPRVALRVVRVDEIGFTYEIRTWGDSALVDPSVDVTADWVAYADRPTAPSARR